MSATLEKARDLIRANSPKESFALKWVRVNDNAIKSECGLFTVGKYSVPAGTFFSVWFKPEGGQAMNLRNNLPDGTSAKEWASSIAMAYRRGHISLKAPPTAQEIQDAKRAQEVTR